MGEEEAVTHVSVWSLRPQALCGELEIPSRPSVLLSMKLQAQIDLLRAVLDKIKEYPPCNCDLLYGYACPCVGYREEIRKALEATKPA